MGVATMALAEGRTQIAVIMVVVISVKPYNRSEFRIRAGFVPIVARYNTQCQKIEG